MRRHGIHNVPLLELQRHHVGPGHTSYDQDHWSASRKIFEAVESWGTEINGESTARV